MIIYYDLVVPITILVVAMAMPIHNEPIESPTRMLKHVKWKKKVIPG